LLSHSQVQSTIVANVTQPALPIVSELNKELHPDLVDKYRLNYNKDNRVFLSNFITIHGNEFENLRNQEMSLFTHQREGTQLFGGDNDSNSPLELSVENASRPMNP